jgi:hypothetical protein
MRVVINRFLTFSAQNVTDEVVWALVVIYFILVAVTLASIWGLHVGLVAKLAWSLLAIVLPVAGIALYCFRCLLRADFSFLGQFGIKFGSRRSLSKLSAATKT